ncbi:cell division protein SepF [Desulfosporosinus metallidurans]|nr:cell division protein SepF [Desulfosporosinus metallidurans]
MKKRTTKFPHPRLSPCGSPPPIGPIIELMVPTDFEDAKHIGDKLKNKTIVALNLTKVDPNIAERILDFAVGVTYALGGGSLKLDTNIFLLTGQGVTLTQ